MTTDPGDLVLDPTCGSGTTAYVAEQWGRRWITIDTSRVALALARTRLMAREVPVLPARRLGRGHAQGGRARPASRRRSPLRPTGDIRKGFVYERVPARHPQVDRPEPGHPRGHDAARRSTPRSPATPRPRSCSTARTRTARSSASPGRSPSRACRPTASSPTAPRTCAPPTDAPIEDAGRFVDDHPRQPPRAPASRTRSRASASSFDRLDPSRASASRRPASTPRTGRPKTVAVAIGPEFGTVGPELVREAAKEAVRLADLLVVCGFAFDPLARGGRPCASASLTDPPGPHEPRPRDGRRAAQEDRRRQPVHGLRRARHRRPPPPATASSRSRSAASTSTTRRPARSASTSTDDIASWFIDTDYDGDAFFVRHAYFTGADDPYDKLRRALRADIDDDGLGDAQLDRLAARSRARARARSPSRSSTTTATRS